LSQPNQLDYSDKPPIVIKVVVAIKTVVIVVEVEQTALTSSP